jgi:putative glutamine amidotransferase
LSNRPLIGIPAGIQTTVEYGSALTFRFNGNYPAALSDAGAVPIAIPLRLPESILRDLYERLDGLCLAGGVDVAPQQYGEEPHPQLGEIDPDRDETEILLTRWALADDIPVLGICRGIQLLNVAAGGTLYQDLSTQRPELARHQYRPAESAWEITTHDVVVAAGSTLAQSLGTESAALPVNSFHHQAVKDVAPEFQAVAWSGLLVEAIESPNRRFCLGVQWHPEGMYLTDPIARKLFAAFVASAQAHMG